MSANWNWPKVTALATVQSMANSLLTLIVGHSLFDVPWWTSLGIAGATGLTTLLRSIVAYTLPQGTATAIMSASVASAQDAKTAQEQVEDQVIPPHDVRGARGW